MTASIDWWPEGEEHPAVWKLCTGHLSDSCEHMVNPDYLKQQPFYGLCPGLLGEPVPGETFTHSHLSLSASSVYCDLFNFHAWQSFCKSFLVYHLVWNSPLIPIHFFTQSLSFFYNTLPHYHNLFCCSTEIMSSNPSLSLIALLGILSFTLISHIRLTILIAACWSATSFLSLQARFHFHATYYFSHICCSPSYNQWYIYIRKQWYQLPDFIPSKSNSGLHSCIIISIHI